MLLPSDFVYRNIPITWTTIAYGVHYPFVGWSVPVEIANWRLDNRESDSDLEIQLAGVRKDDDYMVPRILDQLVALEDEPIEVTQQKWLYLWLLHGFNMITDDMNIDSYLEDVASISDFPEVMRHLLIYTPTNSIEPRSPAIWRAKAIRDWKILLGELKDAIYGTRETVNPVTTTGDIGSHCLKLQYPSIYACYAPCVTYRIQQRGPSSPRHGKPELWLQPAPATLRKCATAGEMPHFNRYLFAAFGSWHDVQKTYQPLLKEVKRQLSADAFWISTWSDQITKSNRAEPEAIARSRNGWNVRESGGVFLAIISSKELSEIPAPASAVDSRTDAMRVHSLLWHGEAPSAMELLSDPLRPTTQLFAEWGAFSPTPSFSNWLATKPDVLIGVHHQEEPEEIQMQFIGTSQINCDVLLTHLIVKRPLPIAPCGLRPIG